jgi:PIN domain nuclease of toxin-antitoxin system
VPFLLDTHVWFWHAMDSARLPRRLRDLIDRSTEALWLSPISVWELGMLNARGRVRVPGGVRAWSETALREFPLREAMFNREVAAATVDLTLPHRDPADRFLAATALVYGLTLMTVDERLVATEWLPTRSE